MVRVNSEANLGLLQQFSLLFLYISNLTFLRKVVKVILSKIVPNLLLGIFSDLSCSKVYF